MNCAQFSDPAVAGLVRRISPLARGRWIAATRSPLAVVSGEVPAHAGPGTVAVLELPDPEDAGFSDSAIRALETCIPLDGSSKIPGCITVRTRTCSVALYAGAGMEEAAEAAGNACPSDSWAWCGQGGNPDAVSPVPVQASRESGLAAAFRNQVVRDRIACVTGGAQGFGEEIVRGLVASGAFVYIADMNAEGARILAERLEAETGRKTAAPIFVNVADETSVASMFDRIAESSGGLDLVVSNAGVLKASSVLDQDLAAFRFVTEVNYTAFMLVTKYAGLLMREQYRASLGTWRTDIIQINSKSGLQGSNRNGSYAGSKFGSLGLVQSFAMELVEYGIKVNAICPGNFFDGPLWSDPRKGLFVQYLTTGKVPGAKTIADVKAFYEAKVPMRRGCTGPDVMRALYYLVEQEYETGQALPVTGGQVMLS